MHLLYLDESGHEQDPTTEFFVLAGFSIFERQTHWLDSEMAPIAARFNALEPNTIEFHGAVMRSGNDGWKAHAPADRVQAVVDILALLANPQLKLRVFAAVIEKTTMAPDQVLPKAFEHVASSFDKYLGNFWVRRRDAQRGLVIFDKTSYEQKLQALSYLFKHQGHSSGKLRNFSEVPLFLDSKASRLIQMADLIAYWIFRYFQAGDDRGYKMIAPYFHCDRNGPCGLTTLITPETAKRLTQLPPQAYPFPSPTLAVPAPEPESVVPVQA